jgi:hypothetical protein
MTRRILDFLTGSEDVLTFARVANDPSLAFVHEGLAIGGLFLNTPGAIAVDTPDRQFMVVALTDSNGV